MRLPHPFLPQADSKVWVASSTARSTYAPFVPFMSGFCRISACLTIAWQKVLFRPGNDCGLLGR
jgi:hypothetical protein